MKRYLSKLLSSLLITILAFNFMIEHQKTYASSTLTFTETTVVLMPEYNKHPNKDILEPNLLVGFHGTFFNDTEESITEITIPVPTSKSNFALSLVASTGTDDDVTEIKNKVNEKGETVTLSFDEPVEPGATKKIMIEYFYTPISAEEGKKSFTYDFNAFADAESMNMILFEPYYAETFTAVPTADKTATDSMGVKMHLYQYQDVKQGETTHYKFSYIKEDNLTTIEMVEQITSENAETVNANETQDNAVQPSNTSASFFSVDVIFAIVLIALIILGFIAWFVRKGNRMTKSNEVVQISSKTNVNKKELRRMLAEGEINEEQYMKELSKLG